ncbi:MAG TPA: hypothetical protein PKB14_23410 [Rubrivivax sp.]|nr:hypothetical protein [Rubrivivax sp.]
MDYSKGLRLWAGKGVAGLEAAGGKCRGAARRVKSSLAPALGPAIGAWSDGPGFAAAARLVPLVEFGAPPSDSTQACPRRSSRI